MPRTSAGLLMYRRCNDQLQVLLVHPGGPFFKNKDDEAWSIPKGEIDAGEDPLAAAQREFKEELGFKPTGPFVALSPIKQKGGKTVHAWACEGDCDTSRVVCNTFSMEWPPRSGQQAEFPEIDRAELFDAHTARKKMNAAQAAWITELELLLIQKP